MLRMYEAKVGQWLGVHLCFSVHLAASHQRGEMERWKRRDGGLGASDLLKEKEKKKSF